MQLQLVLALAAVAFVSADTEVLFWLAPNNQDVLERTLDEVSDPKSERYGQWLDWQAVTDIVGMDAQTEKQIRDFLATHDAHNVVVKGNRDYVSAFMPDAAIAAVKTRLPSSISGMTVLERTEENARAWGELRSSIATRRRARRIQSGDAVGDPSTQKTSYGIPTSLQCTNPGHSQMVWGTGTYGYLASDLQQFYSYFNLPDDTPHVSAAGGAAGTPGGDNFGEATLDVTYVSSMALGVQTYVSNTDNSSSTEWGLGFGVAMLNFFVGLSTETEIPTVLSLSLGSLSWDSCNILCTQAVAQSGGSITMPQCTAYMNTQRQVCMYPDSDGLDRMNLEFLKLGTRGMTIVAAAGDGGSHFSFGAFPNDAIGSVLNTVSCLYNLPTFPAESPYVLGVGGTQWSISPQQPVYWVGGGSGFSWRYPRPAYQTTPVAAYLKANSATIPPAYTFNGTNRAYPDVATLANNVPIVEQGQLFGTGGTSASAPEFAGIISLLNDHRLNNNLPPLGFLNPRLYQLYAANPGVLFYDMSTGNSACGSDGTCCSNSFPSAVGWDATTGMGSPLWTGLLKFLGSD